MHLNNIDSIHKNQPILTRVQTLKLQKDAEQKVEPKNGYTKLKRSVYLLLERPETNIAMLYHLTSFLLIIGSLVISVLITIEEFVINNDILIHVNVTYEFFILSIFSIEFCLRLWSCSYVSRYQGFRGRLVFMKSVYMVVDVFVILSTTTAAILQINALYVTVLRITRFLQILRLLRMDRQRGDLRFMVNVVRQHSKELITCYFVGFIILFSGSYIVYLCEKPSESDSKISNMADGLYWAMITVTSVGYGDFSPTTWSGKFAAGVFAVMGCAFFSLPAGILGSGFALMVDKQKKERRFIKTRHPAAILIQTCWRNHKLKREALGPIWYKVLTKLKYSSHSVKDTPPSRNGLMRRKFKQKQGIQKICNNASMAGNLSSKEKKPKTIHSSTERPSEQMKNSLFEDEALLILPSGKYEHRRVSLMNSMSRSIYQPSKSGMHIKYRGVLRFIMRIKYWYAVRCFKNARHPYVNVQDILDKTAHSNAEMLNSLREMKSTFSTFQKQFDEMRSLIQEMKCNNENPRHEIRHEARTIEKHIEESAVAAEQNSGEDVNDNDGRIYINL